MKKRKAAATALVEKLDTLPERSSGERQRMDAGRRIFCWASDEGVHMDNSGTIIASRPSESAFKKEKPTF